MSKEADKTQPASDGWKRGLPAVAAGAVAVLLAAYGTFALPSRLPAFYSSAKDRVQSEYRTLVAQPESNAGRLQRAGAELDIVYSRLVALERQDVGLIWEWGSFLDAHSKLLQQRMADPVASFTDSEREAVEQQLAEFRQKASRNFEILAAGDSQFAFPATLWLVEGEYRRGLSQFGVPAADELAERLGEAMAVTNGATHAAEGVATAPERARQLRRGQLLQSRLLLEAAWQQTPGSRLSLSGDLIQQAAEVLASGLGSDNAGDALGSAGGSAWQTTQQLVQAYAGRELDAAVADESMGLSSLSAAAAGAQDDDWLSAVCNIEAACLAGDWEGAGFLLARQRAAGDLTAAAVMGRSVCRLAVSPTPSTGGQAEAEAKMVTTGAWQPRLDFGLQLVAQAAAFVPEFSELLWAAALSKLDTDERPESVAVAIDPVVAERISEIIAAGSSAELKHAMFALAAALRDELEPAKNHLQLAKRSGGNLVVLSRVVLWRVQSLAGDGHQMQFERLAGLLEVGTELEEQNGLLWFALGVVQSRLVAVEPRYSELASASLTRAKELLGDVPAIEELLQALGQR